MNKRLKYIKYYYIYSYYIYMGYVYLLYDINNNTYKIGVTRKLDGRRFAALQTGNSSKLELKETYETDYPFRLETMLHKRFIQYKENNEWFKLPEDIAYRFRYYCGELNNIIKIMEDNPFFNKNLK